MKENQLENMQKNLRTNSQKLRDVTEKEMTKANVDSLQAIAWSIVHWCDTWRLCCYNLDRAE